MFPRVGWDLDMNPKKDIDSRIFKPPDGCWLWEGATSHDGYARAHGKYLHRTMYEQHVGTIEDGLTLDHKCRVRHCVNPEHLAPMTLAENIAIGNYGWRAKLTHCKHGHEFTTGNTIVKVDGGRNGAGSRQCRECGRIAQRSYQASKKAK